MPDRPDIPEEAVEIAKAVEAKGLTWAEACFGGPKVIVALRYQGAEEERARLGMVECPNCEDGVVSGTDTERDPDGSIVPVPVQEPCATCNASGYVPGTPVEFESLHSAIVDSARRKGAEEERERVRRRFSEDLRIAAWVKARLDSILDEGTPTPSEPEEER